MLTTSGSFCFFSGQGPPYFLAEKTQKWSEVCVADKKVLASVRNQAENDEIASLLSKKTWIGLSKHHWKRWSNQKHRSFNNWDQNFVNKMQGHADTLCGTINTTTGRWGIFNCMSKFNFVCHRIYYRKQLRLKVKFETEADLQDPGVQQQILEQVLSL